MRENATISYDVPASLEKWLSPQSGQLRTTQPIYSGTLTGCVREFMMKPISQRPLYRFLTDAGSILEANDIVDISERDDFPRE